MGSGTEGRDPRSPGGGDNASATDEARDERANACQSLVRHLLCGKSRVHPGLSCLFIIGR